MLNPTSLINVTLEAPLILNERQVRMLVQKYGTNSPDRMTALSGAWTLRREILQMGHDGIIAVGSKPNKKPLTLVSLAQPGEVARPANTDKRRTLLRRPNHAAGDRRARWPDLVQ